MSTDMAVRQTQMAAFEPGSFAEFEAMAKYMSTSSVIPEALRGKPADIMVTAMTGRDLGLSFTQSLRGIYIVKGHPFMSADLIVAIILRSGLARYFRCTESTPERATYQTCRQGDEPVSLTYTIEQAKKAGLAGKDVWASSSEDMLRHRAASKLGRMVYPDVLLGVYAEDEASLFVQPSAPQEQQQVTRLGGGIAVASSEPAPDKKPKIETIVARLAKLGVDGQAMSIYLQAHPDGDEKLLELGKAIKAGTMTPEAVSASLRGTAQGNGAAGEPPKDDIEL